MLLHLPLKKLPIKSKLLPTKQRKPLNLKKLPSLKRKPKRLPLTPNLQKPSKWMAKLFLKRTVKHATAA